MAGVKVHSCLAGVWAPASGSSTASVVPAPGGLAMLDRAADGLDAVEQAGDPGPALRVGAADAVVANLQPERAAIDPAADRGAGGAGVLDDVRQRLGDDEVGGRLERRGQPLGGTSTSTGRAKRLDDRLDAGAEAAAAERRGQDAAREVAQLGGRALGVLERLVDERGAPGRRRRRAPPGELERDDGVHEPLLRAVVDVALEPPARLVGGRDDRARDAVSSRAVLGVRDRGRDEVGELREAVLGPWRQRAVGRDRPRTPQTRPSTTIGAPTDACSPIRAQWRRQAGHGLVAVDPSGPPRAPDPGDDPVARPRSPMRP